MEKEKKFTIHDLVLSKIEYHKPLIEMTDETEGTAKYFTKVKNCPHATELISLASL